MTGKSRTVEVRDRAFFIDDEKIQVISGSIHYFRVHQDLWRDRLGKMQQCGLNTVETYCCWNLHEKREGEFDFSGMLDVVRFIETAAELGLNVIVRPGPYICSEWDLGGHPAWLLNKEGMILRRFNKPYLDAMEKYFAKLIPLLVPMQCTKGGPIIAMQVENEYGCHCRDKEYLQAVGDIMKKYGVDVTLFTSDPGWENVESGTLPGYLQTVNFRCDPSARFAVARKLRPDDPDFAMEYWSGKSHFWGDAFWRRDPREVEAETRQMLQMGANINFYMFHGGTDFGFMNGANYLVDKQQYKPFITSYDVDAPLNEAGDPTEKYFAIQKVIRAHCPNAKTGTPSSSPKRAYGKVKLSECVDMLKSLGDISKKRYAVDIEPMESYGQSHGFILYRTYLDNPRSRTWLCIDGLRDRAQVFIDGEYLGVLNRNDGSEVKMGIEIPRDGAQLDLLVENQGRVNNGGSWYSENHKGIIGKVTICGQTRIGWEVYPLPLDNISGLKFSSCPIHFGHPAFYKGYLDVDDVCDTFIRIPSGEKGVCWINGFNIGRYWNIGPQYTLYIPAPLLRKGRNEIVVLEQHGLADRSVEFVDFPHFSSQARVLP